MSQWSISKRPSKLSELYGLDNIKKYWYEKAKNQDWPKATLLRGQFGNGKTTSAKIIAAMMVCQSPNNLGDPCCQCASCKSILEERWDRDVILIDGGQSGKADVVEIVSEFTATAPMYDKRKVIIIEEIQELSTAAKNSLLKTLEHPKEKIHFILLSMEFGMASGFASRCVPFNFKKIPIKEIMFYLKSIMDSENLWSDKSIPDEFRMKGLATLAQVSAGSLRQAIQMLELCIKGNYFTAKEIEDNLGFLDESTIIEILVKFLSGDDSVWQALDNYDAFEFFSVALKIISDAEMFQVSQYLASDNDFFNANTKKVAGSPGFGVLRDTFLALGPLAKPFLRKSEMLIHLGRAYRTIKSMGMNRLQETSVFTSTPSAVPQSTSLTSEILSMGAQPPTRTLPTRKLGG